MKFAEYLLTKSKHPAFVWIVFIMTVFESIFLFIPPEVFMAPPIVAERKRALPTIIAASLGSVVGGIISYMIGMWLFDSVGLWLINTFSDINTLENTVIPMFNRYGILIIMMTALTPIPYKLLALWLGFIGYPILIFLAVAAIFRTSRFAIIGFLLWRFQNQANTIMKKYFWPITIGAIVAVLIGTVIVTHI